MLNGTDSALIHVNTGAAHTLYKSLHAVNFPFWPRGYRKGITPPRQRAEGSPGATQHDVAMRLGEQGFGDRAWPPQLTPAAQCQQVGRLATQVEIGRAHV